MVFDMFVTCNLMPCFQNTSARHSSTYYMSLSHGCVYSNKEGLHISCVSWRPNISWYWQHSQPRPHCCHEVLPQTGEIRPTAQLLCPCTNSRMPKAVNASRWTSGWTVNNLWGMLWYYRCPAHTISAGSCNYSSKNVYSDGSAWKTVSLEAMAVEEAYLRLKGLGTHISAKAWFFLAEDVVHRQVQILYYFDWFGHHTSQVPSIFMKCHTCPASQDLCPKPSPKNMSKYGNLGPIFFRSAH